MPTGIFILHFIVMGGWWSGQSHDYQQLGRHCMTGLRCWLQACSQELAPSGGSQGLPLYFWRRADVAKPGTGMSGSCEVGLLAQPVHMHLERLLSLSF